MVNGQLLPNVDEAKALHRIFERYLKGDSYLVIAGLMDDSGIHYHADTAIWNKHMIKRILENTRYTGADGWPEIISADTFDKATEIRLSKTEGRCEHPSCNATVKRKLVCATCGSPFRITTSYRKGMRWWSCGSDKCTNKLKIADSELELRITALMNNMIAQPELLDISPTSVSMSLEAGRIQNELYRELNKTDWDENYAVSLAFACTAEQYETLGDKDIIKQEAADLKTRLIGIAPLIAFDNRLFKEAVTALMVSIDGTLALKLISGNLITENESGEVEHNAFAGY
jgi:hypothetical protein